MEAAPSVSYELPAARLVREAGAAWFTEECDCGQRADVEVHLVGARDSVLWLVQAAPARCDRAGGWSLC